MKGIDVTEHSTGIIIFLVVLGLLVFILFAGQNVGGTFVHQVVIAYACISWDCTEADASDSLISACTDEYGVDNWLNGCQKLCQCD